MRLFEGFQHPGNVAFRYSRTRVANRDNDAAAFIHRDRDVDFPSMRRELYSVGEKVVEYLDQRPFIAAHGWRIGGHVGRQDLIGGFGQLRQLPETNLNHAGNINGFFRQFIFARFNPGKIENIVDQAEQKRTAVMDVVGVFLVAGVGKRTEIFGP